MKNIILILLILSTLTLCGCSAKEIYFDEAAWSEKVAATDASLLHAPHKTEEGIFFNPWLERERNSFSFTQGIKFFFSEYEFPPFDEAQYTHLANDYSYLKDIEDESISFAGHATFIIKTDNQTIITDPFFSNYALVVGKSVRLKFDFDNLAGDIIVLISHNHYDHLDEYSVKELIKRGATFIVPLNMKDFFEKLGTDKVYELDWWDKIDINDISYTFLPAQHWSRRLWQTQNSTLWGGFMIEGKHTYYFSGDTGYFKGFSLLGKIYNINYALVAAGAYMPRAMMHYSHQNIDEFFKAVNDLNADISIPMHFGVIELGKEPLLYPLHEINEYITLNPEFNKKVKPLRVGEYINTPFTIQSN